MRFTEQTKVKPTAGCIITADQNITFQTINDTTIIQLKLQNDKLWLTLNQLASLFERDKGLLSKHLNNSYANAELDRASTMQKYNSWNK